ncbi:hypothetical protein R3P38DRAFT_2981801 [Favolaschia claudopus]|uniref:Uncharacterized protein n=1 Tax=Favolaschia claudopus TaxID=2862362 RepID=A0AAW0AZQ0_9AGAR
MRFAIISIFAVLATVVIATPFSKLRTLSTRGLACAGVEIPDCNCRCTCGQGVSSPRLFNRGVMLHLFIQYICCCD